jgi:hypothetical protein
MPAHSKAQWKFMGAVASGSIKVKGLSKSAARDYLHKSKGHYSSLPNKAKKR